MKTRNNIKPVFKSFLICFVLLSNMAMQGQTQIDNPSSFRWVLHTNQAAERFEDAFVTGNGSHGAMVMGQVRKERITQGTAPLRALIIDGQNNHSVWPQSTIVMRDYLEETDLFEVDIARTQYIFNGQLLKNWLPLAGVGERENLEQPKYAPDFAPDFAQYDVVICNLGYGAADWPEATRKSFEQYVYNGGGFVSVHAADNCFAKWEAYNKIIGLGGWGGRTADAGSYVYYNHAGELIRDDSPGPCGGHGAKHEFLVTVRVTDHPITDGMPDQWMTAADECYARLRGPAENMTVLATGKDSSDKAPTDRHEPVMMTIEYGEGRIFHTTLGHDMSAFQGVGFILSFTRGAEWAASGRVTQAIPKDFPTPAKSSQREFLLKP